MNCFITIHDMHIAGGEKSRSELMTKADISGSESLYTVEYDEQSEGMKDCKTCIRVTDSKCVEIIRKGSYNMVMKIEKGRHNICCYSTPVGNISMGISALHIFSDFSGGRLKKLEFSYELDADNSLIGKNKIRIVPEYKEDL